MFVSRALPLGNNVTIYQGIVGAIVRNGIHTTILVNNMAAALLTKRTFSLLKGTFFPVREGFVSARGFSVSLSRSEDDSQGLFAKILGVGSLEKAIDAHSKVLTERETLYEFECKFIVLLDLL